MKITCTKKVRALLIELDQTFAKFISQTSVLAGAIDNSSAMDVGASREATKAMIIGVAWRINKASKGIED